MAMSKNAATCPWKGGQLRLRARITFRASFPGTSETPFADTPIPKASLGNRATPV